MTKQGEVSTGTTIMAVPFKGGVVLGADTRTSTGIYVASRTTTKIAQLTDRIWCCRSGSAADTQALTDYARHYLSQLSIETGRPPTVKTAAHLLAMLVYENKDNLSAGCIVGGYDSVNGGSVYNVPMGGTCLESPFALGGSGSLFIYGLVDAEYKEDMTKEEVQDLVKKSIAHAMARDGSSGGMLRMVTVTEEANEFTHIGGDSNSLPYGP